MNGQVVPLFHREKLQVQLDGVMRQIPDRVDAIPADKFRASSDEAIVELLLPNSIWMPLAIYEDRKDVHPTETMVDITRDRARDTSGGRITQIKGVRVDVSVPFTGGTGLWNMTPNQCPSRHPYGYIDPPSGDGGMLHIIRELPNDVPMERLKPEIENELTLIRSFIGFQTGQLNKHNQEVAAMILSLVQGRRHRLNLHQTIPDILGIPLKRKDGAPSFEPIEIRRKFVRPLPTTPKFNRPSEYGISKEGYQNILTVIRHGGRTFETMPRTFAIHDEEELRDFMLAHLNCYYEGAASGEAFRKSGKTDVKIEEGNRAAFISEFKIWRGAKEFTASIDQLLSYLTWRDSKAALVIFNKENAKFSEILAKMPDLLRDHPKFKGEVAFGADGEWKALFSSAEDDDHLVTITVFAFNIFVPLGK